MNDLKEESRITCLVPKQMLPNKKAFIDLGFTFHGISDAKLCLATLPNGWRSVPNEDFAILLIDEKGRERGLYIYAGSHLDSFIGLKNRFYISEDSDPEKTNTLRISVRDQINGASIFSPGECNSRTSTKKRDKLMCLAKAFLDIHYPDWRNPANYWDEE